MFHLSCLARKPLTDNRFETFISKYLRYIIGHNLLLLLFFLSPRLLRSRLSRTCESHRSQRHSVTIKQCFGRSSYPSSYTGHIDPRNKSRIVFCSQSKKQLPIGNYRTVQCNGAGKNSLFYLFTRHCCNKRIYLFFILFKRTIYRFYLQICQSLSRPIIQRLQTDLFGPLYFHREKVTRQLAFFKRCEKEALLSFRKNAIGKSHKSIRLTGPPIKTIFARQTKSESRKIIPQTRLNSTR